MSDYHDICLPTGLSSGSCIYKNAFRKLYTNTIGFYFIVYSYVNFL